MKRLLNWLLVFGTGLSLIAIFQCFKQRPILQEDQLIAQSTYMGPKGTSLKPQLIRVEVLVHDSPDSAGVQIQSVTFNNKNVPLKPRDIYGYRGGASFQLYPGVYNLQWTVNQSRSSWPRSVSHEEEVTLNPRDLWVQIGIIGENATIQ